MKKTAAGCLVVLLAWLCSTAPAIASSNRLVLAVGGAEKIIYLPATIALIRGFFDEEGLDVDLRSEPAGIEAQDELLAGGIAGVVGFYDHTIHLQARGKAVQSVVLLTLAPGQAELVSTRIGADKKSFADLRGLKFGVTGLGASTSYLSRYLAIAAGLKGSEIALVPVGAGNTFLAAMQNGTIDAGMTTEPTVTRVLDAGVGRILVDLRTPADTERVLGGPYPSACLYLQSAWIQGHRQQTQSLVNAFEKALRYLRTHSAEEIAAQVPPSYFAGDREMYIRVLKGSLPLFSADGSMPPQGPATVLKVLSTIDRKVDANGIFLSHTFTNDFVEASRRNPQ